MIRTILDDIFRHGTVTLVSSAKDKPSPEDRSHCWRVRELEEGGGINQFHSADRRYVSAGRRIRDRPLHQLTFGL